MDVSLKNGKSIWGENGNCLCGGRLTVTGQSALCCLGCGLMYSRKYYSSECWDHYVYDVWRLQRFRDDPQEQCSELLMILHGSENQQAFIQLHSAIKRESHLQWLVERIDKFSDESVIDLLQQIDISEPTGCVNMCFSDTLLHTTT